MHLDFNTDILPLFAPPGIPHYVEHMGHTDESHVGPEKQVDLTNCAEVFTKSGLILHHLQKPAGDPEIMPPPGGPYPSPWPQTDIDTFEDWMKEQVILEKPETLVLDFGDVSEDEPTFRAVVFSSRACADA